MCRRKSVRSAICQPHGDESAVVSFVFTMASEDAQEHFWGCQLTKDDPSVTWTFEEEEDDSDFLVHTLFLKHAVLGTSALRNERNVVQIETKNFDKEDVKMPFLSLTLGSSDMCSLDLSFSHDIPVTFKLIEGAGPVCLAGQHLVEFPPEEYFTQDESALEGDISEEESPKKGRKRKAGKQPVGKSKKGKKEESMSSVDDEDEEEDDEEEEEDEDEEEEESMDEDEDEEDKKKSKKGKADAKKGKKTLKATKASPKRAAGKKAGGKKGKK